MPRRSEQSGPYPVDGFTTALYVVLMSERHDECPNCGGTKDKRSVQCRKCMDGPQPTEKKCRGCLIVLPVSDFRIRTRKVPRPRSMCRKCETQRDLKRYQNQPPQLRKAATRRWEKENPDRVRLQQLRRRCRVVGLAEEEIPRIVTLLSADPACDICGMRESETDRSHHLDHSHGTGKFRGILCEGCNLGLGKFRDDPSRLRSAMEYLLKPR
jgi:hypothetical protein